MDKSRTPYEIRGALIGTLLGDSWISNGRTFGCQQISRNLIELKAKLISHYTKDYPKVFTIPEKIGEIRGRKVHMKESYIVRGDHARFRKWHKEFYATGSKQVTPSILNRLTEEGLAMWFMDDGYLDYKRSNSTRNLRLCTDSFDERSVGYIQDYFKSFGIDSKIYYHSSGKGFEKRPRVSFNASNSQKLIPIISPYFLDEFLYKIDLRYLEDTIMSNRCSDAYREAHLCIKQRMAYYKSNSEDIV